METISKKYFDYWLSRTNERISLLSQRVHLANMKYTNLKASQKNYLNRISKLRNNRVERRKVHRLAKELLRVV